MHWKILNYLLPTLINFIGDIDVLSPIELDNRINSFFDFYSLSKKETEYLLYFYSQWLKTSV